MHVWQDDQLGVLYHARSAEQLFAGLVRIVDRLGFERCSYGIRPALPLAQARIRVFDNYPLPWHERYRAGNYVAIDPTVRHGLRSLHPLRWSDALFARVPSFWEDARAHGLRHGWAQPCRDAQGVAGMLTVARSHEPLGDGELRARAPQLAWIAQLAHLGMARLLSPPAHPDPERALTRRERDVLRWCAEGKTAAETAEILGISTRTVNFHLAGAMTAMAASNKTAAAIRAALLGLLY